MCVLIHNLSKEVAVAPGAIGEGGSSAEPAAVWDDDVIYVREEGVSLGHDHGVEAVGARLLHALDDKLHIHWQILVDERENKSSIALDLFGSKMDGDGESYVEKQLVFGLTGWPFFETVFQQAFAHSKIMSC